MGAAPRTGYKGLMYARGQRRPSPDFAPGLRPALRSIPLKDLAGTISDALSEPRAFFL